MYKLIIVDDEAVIRNGIANSLPWQELGFVVTARCSNGQEALEAIEKEMPDVVISDIHMPKMDGTQLMRVLNERYPQIKIVILSGYSDFEYLNISIKSKVIEYLLKPTDPDEMKKIFKKIKENLDLEREEIKKITLWKSEYELNKDRYFKDWIDTCIKGYSEDAYYEDEFYEKDMFPIDRIENCYIFVLVPDGHLGDDPKDLHLLNSKIVQICNQVDSDLWQGSFCLSYEDTIMGLLDFWGKAREPEIDEILMKVAQELQQEVRAEKGISISVGISENCNNIQDISTCYTQAKSCALQNVFLGKENIFLYTQFEDGLHLPQANLRIDLIQNAVLNHEFSVYEEELQRGLNLFAGRPVKEYGYIDTMCVVAMQSVAQAAMQYSVWPEQIMSSLGVTFADVSRCSSLEEKMSFTTAVLFAFDKAIVNESGMDKKTAVSAAGIKRILDLKYTQNSMSLEYVANEMNLSPAYISRTFKNTYQLNFSVYLTNLRMQEAKRLLRETKQKIYEVSENVGYADASNFIKLFKKQFGMSPKDYQAQAHEENYESKEGIKSKK